MTYTSPKILEHPIARHIDQNIRDIEDRQRDIELIARQLEVLDQAIDLGIANVRAVDERQQPQTEQPRNLDAASTPCPKSVRSVSRAGLLTMRVSNLRVMRRSSAASIPRDSTRLNSAASMCDLPKAFSSWPSGLRETVSVSIDRRAMVSKEGNRSILC